jgi:hypothetical protein
VNAASSYAAIAACVSAPIACKKLVPGGTLRRGSVGAAADLQLLQQRVLL